MTQRHGRVPRVLRTLGTGAVGGAAVGIAVELGNDLFPGGLPFASLVDVWPPALAIVGLVGAALMVLARDLTHLLRPPEVPRESGRR